jgi:hypothetical protein
MVSKGGYAPLWLLRFTNLYRSMLSRKAKGYLSDKCLDAHMRYGAY